MQTKKCTSCHKEKELSLFHKSSYGKLGRRSDCSACCSQKKKARYAAMSPAEKEKYLAGKRALPLTPEAREKKNRRQREWYRKKKQNEEWKKEHNRKYRKWRSERMKDPAVRNEYNRKRQAWRSERLKDPAYRQKLRDYDSEYVRERRKRDPEFAKARNEIARRRNLSGYNLERLEDGECYYCGVHGSMTGDHIIPLAWIQRKNIAVEIIKNPRNIVSACSTCNSSKGARIPKLSKGLKKVNRLLGYPHAQILEITQQDYWKPPVLEPL